ncbi:MAG: peptide transporter [Lachnospiraceae bacterium]|nr:peptide transporter [Lachnospiraceae bacterium]
MRHLLRLTDLQADGINEIFRMADEINAGKYRDALKGKSIVLFFPNTSIRTRVTFEKGIYLLGGQPILFPGEALDRREDIRDVCGYLDNWADMLIVRHSDIGLLERMAACSAAPVVNAMTDVNHPCEILSDLYALSKCREDFTADEYLFCGRAGNIGLAWKEASRVLGLRLSQCCAAGYEMDGVPVFHNIAEAIRGKDIVCTDSLPAGAAEEFRECRVTPETMSLANSGALLNPCPPFFRGEEVSGEVMESPFFVGYGFKRHLLTVQQAVILYCLFFNEIQN